MNLSAVYLDVQTDSESLQLLLNELLVLQRLQNVENDEDERASPGHCYDLSDQSKHSFTVHNVTVLAYCFDKPYLPAPPLAVLGALDDAGEVEQLDLGPLVLYAPGHRGQGLQSRIWDVSDAFHLATKWSQWIP